MHDSGAAFADGDAGGGVADPCRSHDGLRRRPAPTRGSRPPCRPRRRRQNTSMATFGMCANALSAPAGSKTVMPCEPRVRTTASTLARSCNNFAAVSACASSAHSTPTIVAASWALGVQHRRARVARYVTRFRIDDKPECGARARCGSRGGLTPGRGLLWRSRTERSPPNCRSFKKPVANRVKVLPAKLKPPTRCRGA